MKTIANLLKSLAFALVTLLTACAGSAGPVGPRTARTASSSMSVERYYDPVSQDWVMAEK